MDKKVKWLCIAGAVLLVLLLAVAAWVIGAGQFSGGGSPSQPADQLETDGIDTPDVPIGEEGAGNQPTLEQQPTQSVQQPQAPTTSDGTSHETQVAAFKIVYDGLEGTAHTNPQSYTQETAAKIVLSDPTPRSGYVFMGWYIQGTRVETLKGQTGNLVVTAVWQKVITDNAPVVTPDVDF